MEHSKILEKYKILKNVNKVIEENNIYLIHVGGISQLDLPDGNNELSLPPGHYTVVKASLAVPNGAAKGKPLTPFTKSEHNSHEVYSHEFIDT